LPINSCLQHTPRGEEIYKGEGAVWRVKKKKKSPKSISSPSRRHRPQLGPSL